MGTRTTIGNEVRKCLVLAVDEGNLERYKTFKDLLRAFHLEPADIGETPGSLEAKEHEIKRQAGERPTDPGPIPLPRHAISLPTHHPLVRREPAPPADRMLLAFGALFRRS